MPPKDIQHTNDSQQKPGSVKVTYLERLKKSGGEAPADNVALPSNPSSSVSRKPPSVTKSKSDALFKTPDNPIRIVDFRTETSPKRMQNDESVEGPEKSSAKVKNKTPRHSRSSSSIAVADTAHGDIKPTSSGPSPRTKPPSVVSRISHSTNRSQTPASETNFDNASVADSIADSTSISGNRIKRTETERKQYFENQSECGSIEARRAFCTRCKEWVRLSSRQTYYVKPWEVHRAKCDQKLPVEHTYRDLGLLASVPFVVPRTEKARKALLELDDTAETIEPNQMKCKTCQQWVPLEKKFSIKSWTKHKGACHNNLKPSDIEKTLERKLFFMCDPQFKHFRDKHTVECGACSQPVALKSSTDYDLDLWLEHKKTCYLPPEARPQSSSTGASSSAKPEQETQHKPDMKPTSPVKPEASTVEQTVIPERETQPVLPASAPEPATLSTTDSERTLVPPSTSMSTIPTSISISSTSPLSPPAPTPASGSLKRKRDSSEDDEAETPTEGQAGDLDMDEDRPTRRPRTENYIPEDKNAPSGLGWFLLPFKAFVKGFKESLTTLDS